MQKKDSRWPAGFTANPLGLLRSSQTWRSGLWTLVLALIALPLLISSVLLLPWVPLIAKAVNLLTTQGAHWMGVECRRRKVPFGFDWPQCVNLVFHIILSVFAFVVALFSLITAGSLIIYSLLLILGSDAEFHLGSSHITNKLLILAVCWVGSMLCVVIYLYLSWALTGASVYAACSTNASNQEELARVKRSREVLIDAFTGERSRIERELHDGVQQYLTALRLNIGTAKLLVSEENSPTRLLEALEQANSNASRALESLRSTVRGIYPQVLRDQGLIGALQELIAHSGLSGTITENERKSSAQLNATSGLLLYHCAAEGLTNAVRHGNASEICVHVQFEKNHVEITVDDNGEGVPEQIGTGTGLGGLRERASALHGTVQLSPSPTCAGARLCMRLPRTTSSLETHP